MNKKLSLIIKFIAFIAGLSMVVIGQKTIGWPSLGLMMGGLGILLALIYVYNKGYQI